MSSRNPRPLAKMVMVLAVLAAPAVAAAATELLLTQEEVANLGITLATPRVAEPASTLSARGRVVIPPAGDVAVSPAYEGLVVRLLRAVGDRVAPGDVLAEISSAEFLDAQRSFLDALTADALARQRLARDRQLVAEGIVSQRRLDQTEADAAAAAAAGAEHRQMLRIAGLDSAAIDRLAGNRELLAVLPVRAPFDGVVLELSGRAGSGVTPLSPLFRIGDLSTLWLEINLPQPYVRHVQEGMTVVVQAGSNPSARVVAIGGAVDPDTQMVTVRAEVIAEDHGLRPGQFVTAQMIGEAAEDVAGGVWSIPAGSVVQAGPGHFVFVRTESGFQAAPVRHVGTDGDHVLVAAGFGADARLASNGVSALKSLWGGPGDEES